MAAANTITPLKDWKYGIPGHGKPLTKQEREELLRKGWSKNPSPLVNPVLGNQLRIQSNPREQLMAKTPYDSLSGWQKGIIMNQLNSRSGKSYDKEVLRIQTMYPGFRLPL